MVVAFLLLIGSTAHAGRQLPSLSARTCATAPALLEAAYADVVADGAPPGLAFVTGTPVSMCCGSTVYLLARDPASELRIARQYVYGSDCSLWARVEGRDGLTFGPDGPPLDAWAADPHSTRPWTPPAEPTPCTPARAERTVRATLPRDRFSAFIGDDAMLVVPATRGWRITQVAVGGPSPTTLAAWHVDASCSSVATLRDVPPARSERVVYAAFH